MQQMHVKMLNQGSPGSVKVRYGAFES